MILTLLFFVVLGLLTGRTHMQMFAWSMPREKGSFIQLKINGFYGSKPLLNLLYFFSRIHLPTSSWTLTGFMPQKQGSLIFHTRGDAHEAARLPRVWTSDCTCLVVADSPTNPHWGEAIRLPHLWPSFRRSIKHACPHEETQMRFPFTLHLHCLRDSDSSIRGVNTLYRLGGAIKLKVMTHFSLS